MTSPWPRQLPDDLAFDAFDDEDQILDYINSLETNAKKIFLEALDKSRGEDIVIYARNTTPLVHIVLMKFSGERNGGLVLLLSRTENSIFSYFERLKEQEPDNVQEIDVKLNIIFEQIRATDELSNK